jgi:hypothetical protein
MDSCNPTRNLTLKSYRIYSVLIPILAFIFMLESIFVFMAIPSDLGNAFTVEGKLKPLPANPLFVK